MSFSFLKVIFFFFAVDHDAYTRPLPTILHRFFFFVVCVCVVLAAVGFSFGKYNSLSLFAGLFFFTFILPPFSVCVQFWVLCVVWHVQQSVSFLNFVCLFVLHFVM